VKIYVNDSIQVLKKASFRRFSNAMKVYVSYYKSKWSGKPIQNGFPMAIAIEPTTACNLGCPECPSGLKQFTRPTGNLKEDFYKKVIDQVWRETFYLTFYFQGEPYINPKFLDMVRYASHRKMYTTTSTNAHFLTPENALKTVESGLDRLIISVDGTTQKTYGDYRIGGTLEKVLEGTKNIVAAKKRLKSKTPHVIFQFLVVKPNEHQIDEVHELAKKYGVDEVKLKTAQVYNYENGNNLIPENDKYSRYRKLSNGKYQIKNSLENNCWKLWHSCVITWDGKVIPCCFDKDANHRLGELEKDDFKKIWFSSSYNSFREQLFKGRENIDICKNCSEGTKVWA
tara:strand:+ start:23134 stop:24156 length:1023 start_codon:yes stop_codon:yes gene_type:complete